MDDNLALYREVLTEAGFKLQNRGSLIFQNLDSVLAAISEP
jgi:hypothetical protein